MPENRWEQSLLAACSDVLEKMFFTAVYGPAAPGPPEAAPAVGSRVRFAGQPCGALTLFLSQPAARTLTENFLALAPDDPISYSEIGGVVCELCNMICGALLSRAESGEHFRLSSPELIPADGPYAPEPPVSGQYRQYLDLGDGTLRLCLAVGSLPAQETDAA